MFEPGLPQQNNLVVPVSAGDHVRGDMNARYVVVEYADYQCPYCGTADQKMKSLIESSGSKLCYVFRNFPLTEIHPFAEHAAEAAELAGRHGKFWEMHDLLFENQEALDDNSLIRYAGQLGLDTSRFLRDLQAHAALDKIKADFASGVNSGVNGTPSFFLNGEALYGGIPEIIDRIS